MFANQRSRQAGPITLFLPSLNGGGAERVFVNLANEFSRLSERPIHLVLARGGSAYSDQVSSSVTVVDLGKRRTTHALPALIGYIRRERPGVILSTMVDANVVALLARALAGGRCRVLIREANVFSTQGAGFRERVRTRLMSLLYPRADAMVVIATDILDSLHAAGIPTCDRKLFIGNPVRLADHRGRESDLPEVLREREYLCAMGRLVPQKGFDVLIEAFARLNDGSLHLAILGDGPLKEALIAKAQKAKVADRLHFLGFTRHPENILHHARLFVSSSRWEGFPNAIMEALSAGTPIVATSCPGASSLILENGRHGYLVPPDDPARLADAIDASLVAPVGTRATRMARCTDFSPEHIASRYLEAIEAVEALASPGMNEPDPGQSESGARR